MDGLFIFVVMFIIYIIALRKIIKLIKQPRRPQKDSVNPSKLPPNQPLSREEQNRRKEMIRNRMNGYPGTQPLPPAQPVAPQATMAERIATAQNRIDDMGYRPPSLGSFRELEDRKNDWLAKQIREERAYNPIVDDMLNLKIEHARDCDAEELRRYSRHNG